MAEPSERNLDEQFIESQFPRFWPHFYNLGSFAEKFCEQAASSEHSAVVLMQTKVLWDRFRAVILLAGNIEGPSAIILYRSLIELAASIVYLAQDAARLPEFLDAGVKVTYEVIETFGLEPAKLAIIKSDYDGVRAKYPPNKNWNAGWHGFAKRALFAAIGFDAPGGTEFYKLVYPESSDIMHGGAMLTTCYTQGRGWYQQIRSEQWKEYSAQALAASYIVVIETFTRVNRILTLGFDGELAPILAICQPVAERLYEQRPIDVR
ncbi:MAG TPA: hypothetical protein VFE22_15675 [Edaphobacter sp.]|nr:hypothetical protein [Edaphobacter sp.]